MEENREMERIRQMIDVSPEALYNRRRAQFRALVHRINPNIKSHVPDVLFDELNKNYSEEHRVRHTFDHVDDCLREFAFVKQISGVPNELELALWYHHAVHDTKANMNAEKSAAEAEKACSEIGASEKFSKVVSSLVKSSSHAYVPTSIETKLLTDIDLSYLGRPEQAFNEEEGGIRAEYLHVEDSDFIKMRRSFFMRLLNDKRQIFSIPRFKTKYEEQATKNIENFLKKTEPSADLML